MKERKIRLKQGNICKITNVKKHQAQAFRGAARILVRGGDILGGGLVGDPGADAPPPERQRKLENLQKIS